MSRILTVLKYADRSISTKQVANYAEISWKTARDNLEYLFNEGLVQKGRVGKNKRIYWKVDL